MRFRLKSLFLGLVLGSVLSLPLYAREADGLRVMMDAIYARDWAAAKRAASQAKDPVIGEIYEWHALRAGQGRYEDYVAFLEENSEWPGLPWLQKAGEKRIPKSVAPEDLVAFIELNEPQSEEGLVRYLQALNALGQGEKADRVLLEYADEMEIGAESFGKIKAFALPNFDKAVFLQIKTQIYDRELDTLSELDEYLDEEARALVEARLAVLKGEDISPEQLSGGVLYDQMRALKRDDQYDEAAQVMMDASTSRQALDAPERWAEHRLDLARNQLWKGNADGAYKLASSHFLEPKQKGFAELEFLSGLIALEFMNDEEEARIHFLRFKDHVDTPISNGRAGYWLGRAGDPEGFEYGAKWQTSFYGQLAAEALGEGFDPALISTAEDADYAMRSFMSSDNIRAALYLYAAGEELLARRFMAHEAETLTPLDAESLGMLAYDLGMAHTAVNIGKNLAARAEVIPFSYYPIPNYAGEDLEIPHALALAVMRQESEFYPQAESHVGARGLMQLMPATAEEVSAEVGMAYDLGKLKSDPEYNVQLGTKYMRDLLRDFDGKLPVAILSYNAGLGRGIRWQEHLGEFGRGDAEAALVWLEQIPFDETRNYVQRVLEGVFLYQAKLQGSYDGLSPIDLLLRSYPEGVDWDLIRVEDERLAQERREAEKTLILLPEPRPEI